MKGFFSKEDYKSTTKIESPGAIKWRKRTNTDLVKGNLNNGSLPPGEAKNVGRVIASDIVSLLTSKSQYINKLLKFIDLSSISNRQTTTIFRLEPDSWKWPEQVQPVWLCVIVRSPGQDAYTRVVATPAKPDIPLEEKVDTVLNMLLLSVQIDNKRTPISYSLVSVADAWNWNWIEDIKEHQTDRGAIRVKEGKLFHKDFLKPWEGDNRLSSFSREKIPDVVEAIISAAKLISANPSFLIEEKECML